MPRILVLLSLALATLALVAAPAKETTVTLAVTGLH